MESKEIVFITGVAGSGKDYNADIYVKQGYEKFSFADGVRDVAWKCLGWSPKDDKEYQDFKSMPIVLLTREEVINEITGRDLLINIGDGFRDMLDSKIWIKLLEKKLNKSKNTKFVISDCRYPNEVLYFFASYEVVIKFCNYKSERYNNSIDSKSEWMAKKFIDMGYKDGDIIPNGVIIDLQMEFNTLIGVNK